MDCPKCGAYNETDVGSCLSCGAAFPAEDAAAPTMMKPSAKAPAGRLQQAGGPPKQCPNCMTLNAASFGFMIWVLAGMDTERLQPSEVATREPGAVRAGLRYVRREPELWIPLGLMAIVVTIFFKQGLWGWVQQRRGWTLFPTQRKLGS